MANRWSARADEQLTIDATAGGVGFTAAEYETAGVVRAYCQVETAQIRVNTFTAPTSGGSEGSLLKNPGDEFYVTGGVDLKNFRAIREGSTSGLLNIIYEGEGA